MQQNVLFCEQAHNRATPEAKCAPQDFFLIFEHKVKRNQTASDVPGQSYIILKRVEESKS